MALEMMSKPEGEIVGYNVPSVAEYVILIKKSWTKGVDGFFETGLYLIDLKHDHPGEFSAAVVRDLGFGLRKAQMLMRTAQHEVLSSAIYRSHLPPSYRTLDDLTKLPLPTLEAALEDGRIHPAMEQKDVRALIPVDEPAEAENVTCEVQDLDNLILSGRTFGTIYADPPWQYGNQATRAATDNHYVTMTVDDIAALPIAKLAADAAHLHLWTTNAFLFDAKKIIEAWGFEYKSVMVWTKPSMGIGNYWRVSHEFLMLGVRGQSPFLNHGQMSWIQADRQEHSQKPEIFRRTVELVSPGPRLELFGRRLSEGWAVWGNQVERNMFEAAVATIGTGLEGETDAGGRVCAASSRHQRA